MVYLRRRLLLLAAASATSALPRADRSPPPPPVENEVVSTRAWNLDAQCVPGDSCSGHWPELELGAISMKPNAGIAFSGGGSRSYAVSLSYIAALRELGLMDKLRYMTGISGGSWATTVYAYARSEYCCARGCKQTCEAAAQSRRPFNLTRVLSPPLPPDAVTAASLARMPAGSFLEGATRDIYATVTEKVLEAQGDEIWYETVASMYLEPVGIPSNKFFTWSNETASEILARNPKLAASPDAFVTVRGADAAPAPWPNGQVVPPYPIIGTTLLGPKALAPYPTDNKSYTLLEITPLYVGESARHNITYYHWHPFSADSSLNRSVGGYIEPFAFGGTAPADGLPVGATGGILEVPKPSLNFSVAVAAGDSSFAPGSVLAEDFLKISSELDLLGMTLPYWSPASEHPAKESIDGAAQDNVYADGGIVNNLAMIGLIRRGCTTIFACFNTDKPMATNVTWDPTTQPPTSDLIDADIPSYFGIDIQQLGQDLHRDQVFPSADFPRVAVALQAAQAEGNGIVVTTRHRTVLNEWWGVRAGIEVNVTWIVLGRTLNWEAELPAEVRKDIQPWGDGAHDPSKLVKLGPYRNFPLYDTGSQQTLTTPQVNLLASMAQWTVQKNAELLESALESAVGSSGESHRQEV
jgi:hypothetical protein